MNPQILRTLLAYGLRVIQHGSLLLAILTAAFSGVLLAVVLLGLKVDPTCFWGLLLLLPLGIIIATVCRRIAIQKLLSQIREGWGKEQARKRAFSMIDSLHRCCQSSQEDNGTVLDDQTWNDLNMNEVYSKIDRTLTNPGECVLYRMLRTPLLSENELLGRNRVIRLLQTDRAIRERIQLDLRRLGRWDTNVITSLIWGESHPSTPLRRLYSFLALLAAVSAVGAPLLWGTRGIAAIVVVYMVNLVATYRVRARLSLAIAAMRYQGSMILAAKRIANLDCPALGHYCNRLKQASSATKEIARETFLLFPESTISSDLATLAYAHLDIYFLRDVRILHSVMQKIDAYRDELKSLYSMLGELDALQSIASYRKGLSAYVEPTFLERGIQLKVEGVKHPLLADAVPNSITIREGGVTVTGSNMAGKTTFLRTLGVNVVLAQTVCTCVASSYAANLFRIFSLINEADSLLEGKSYYLVQAEHLLRMIRSSERQGRSLCLIDEPLAGTNSPERSAASLEIMGYLASHHATVILATHDLELARRLQDTFKNYYFTGQVTDRGLEFDFRLREGITPVRNAIDLLRYLGFPATIVERAMRQVSTGICT